MEFTDHYIFINNVNAVANATGTEVVVPIRLGTARAPHALFEVISATFQDVEEYSGVVVKSDLAASNYYGADNSGTCIAVLGLDNLDPVNSTTYYSLSGSAPKLVGSSSLQKLTLRLTDLTGDPIALATAEFSLLLKISYPVQGQTSQLFSSQVR